MNLENSLNHIGVESSKSQIVSAPMLQALGERTAKIGPHARIAPDTTTQFGGAEFSIIADGLNSNTRFFLLVRNESGNAEYVNLGTDKEQARSVARALIQNGNVSKSEAVQGNSLARVFYGRSSAPDAAAEEMKARIEAMLAEARASNAEEIERFFFALSGSAPSDLEADRVRKEELLKAQMKIATESIALRIQRCCDGLITKSEAVAGLPESLANRVASLIDSTIAGSMQAAESGTLSGSKSGEERWTVLAGRNGVIDPSNIKNEPATT